MTNKSKPYASAKEAWADVDAIEPADTLTDIKGRLRVTSRHVVDDDDRSTMAKELAAKVGANVAALRKALAFDRQAAKAAMGDKAKKSVGPTDGALTQLNATNRVYAVLQLGDKVRIIQQHRRKNEMAAALEKDAFKTLLENMTIPCLTDAGEVKEKNLGVEWLRWSERRTFYHADLVPFAPGQPDPCAETGAFNYWNGFAFDPAPAGKGSWSLLKAHVRETMCHGNPVWWHWFMTWCAHILQFPGKKMPTAIGVSGLKGTGKTKFFEWLQKIIGDVHARKINQAHHLVGHFNGLQFGLILLVLEEAIWSGDKQASNTLKDIVSSDKMEIEKKGLDAKTVGNFMRLVFISNEAWHLPVQGDDERRYFVLQVKPTWAKGNGREAEGIRLFNAIDVEMEKGGAEAMLTEMLAWDPVKQAKEMSTADGLTEEQAAYLKRAAEFGWNVLRMPPVTEWQHVQAAHGLGIEETFCRDGYRDRGWRDPRSDAAAAVSLSEAEGFDIPVADIRLHWEEACRRDGSQKKGKDLELLRQTLIRFGMIDREPIAGGVMGEGECWRFAALEAVTPPEAWQLSASRKAPEEVQGLAKQFADAIRAGEIIADENTVVDADTGARWFHRKLVENRWREFLARNQLSPLHAAFTGQGIKAVQTELQASAGAGRRINGQWDRAWRCLAW